MVVEEGQAWLASPDKRNRRQEILKKLEESSGNILGYEARDGITEEEFASFEQEFEAAISRYGKVRVLLYMPEVPGVGPGALWEDLKLARRLNDIERYAIVTDSDLTKWGAKVDDALIGGKLKSFDTSRYEEAWRWLREPRGEG